MLTRPIQSLQHPIVGHLCLLRKNRSYREEKGSALVVGRHLLHELGPFKTVIVDSPEKIPPGIQTEELYLATESILKKITGLASPEGLAAEIAIPRPSSLQGKKKILLLDGISDPGNLGTLLRTAAALGWEGVWISEESCDPFNEKALRAAKGATFHLPYNQSEEELSSLLASHTLLIADSRGEPLEKRHATSPLLLALGSEAAGARASLKKKGTLISIPLHKQIESLNVAAAGAILLYELNR